MRVVLFLATLFAAMCTQINGQIFGEKEPWPGDKYNTTTFETIPEGKSDRNSVGYRQSGSFSTVLNEKGQYTLELELILEGPLRQAGFIYSQWFQIRDPVESLKTDDEDDSYYESLVASVLYNELTAQRGVNVANSVLKSYRGEEKLKDATGNYDRINYFDQSSTHPWFFKAKKTSFTRFDDDTVVLRVTLYRPFVTEWSDIPIKIGDTIDWMAGYRVYANDEATSPQAKGYADDLKMQILPIVEGAYITAVTSLLIVSQLVTFLV